MGAPKTHFEQIPIAAVKSIAQEFSSEDAAAVQANEHGKAQTISAGAHWRKIAECVQQEQHPKRMAELVEQLITALDEQQLRRLRPAPVGGA